jgi:hypothetical protein
VTTAGPGAAPPAEEHGVGVEETARLLGAYAWAEGRLFEVLGALAADEGWPQATVLLDAHSQHHAWHASLFAERLPLLPGADPRRLTAAPTAALAGSLDALASLRGTAPRLAVLARGLLPRLVAGYRLHLSRCRPPADGPVVRALRLVVRDEVEAQLEAEALLELALAGPEGPGPALEALAGVEALLAGGGQGVVPWPERPARVERGA